LFERLFGNRNRQKSDEIERKEDINESGEDEEELIAVITAAVSAFLSKPVSGFRVVSFKKRDGWKLV